MENSYWWSYKARLQVLWGTIEYRLLCKVFIVFIVVRFTALLVTKTKQAYSTWGVDQMITHKGISIFNQLE